MCVLDVLNSIQIPVHSCCPEGLQQSVGSNMEKNLEGTGMEPFYKEFKGLIQCHSADVRSREEKENSGYHPVNPASYRLNNPTVESNFTICICIQKQGCVSEHAVTSYLN